jgi:hypothetical protein
MKFILFIAILLQITSILKDVLKTTPKSAGTIAKSTTKVLKSSNKLSKASELLLADDLFKMHDFKNNSLVKEEIKTGATRAEISATERSQIKKIKKVKSADIENSVDELFQKKIEEAIEEQLYETISRSNGVWDYALYELMLEKNWASVQDYFRMNHHYYLNYKIDLFLLLNEQQVGNLNLTKRDVCKIMSKTKIYKSTCIDALIVNLSEYEHIVNRLEMYATRNNIYLRKRNK